VSALPRSGTTTPSRRPRRGRSSSRGAAPGASSPGWHPAWPVVAAFVLYPIWWALGLAPFVWIVAAVPMVFRLLVSSERTRVPRGFGAWMAFMLLVLLSVTQLGPSSRVTGFAFRYAELMAATVIFVYVYNIPKSRLDSDGGLRIIAAVWGSVVLGGYLALLLPDGSVPSLSARLLPTAISSDDFVSQLITPEFAQVHSFLGFPLPRPAAPFTYTNTWGAVYALTIPFVLALTLRARSARQRRLLHTALALGILPALISVNRTMWAAIVLVVGYAAIAAPDPSTRRALRGLLLVGSVLLLALSVTYVGDIVAQRIDTPHSNAARGDLATEAVRTALEAPVLGQGAPQAYDGPGIRPPVGTQGHLWFILVAHGLPALLFFLGWFASAYRSSRWGDVSIAPWFRASVLAGLLMLPFYGMRGMPLNVVLLAAALTLRPDAPSDRARTEADRKAAT